MGAVKILIKFKCLLIKLGSWACVQCSAKNVLLIIKQCVLISNMFLINIIFFYQCSPVDVSLLLYFHSYNFVVCKKKFYARLWQLRKFQPSLTHKHENWSFSFSPFFRFMPYRFAPINFFNWFVTTILRPLINEF